MKIIIVGGGKIGYYLAKALREADHEVAIIEQNKTQSRKFANELDIKVLWGDGSSIAILKTAGAEHCDALIAVTGKDEDNLVACQLAKSVFKVPKTVAKANNPKNAVSLKRFGIDFVLSETENIISAIEREVDNSKLKELITLNGGKSIVIEVTLPENYVLDCKQLCDIVLPENCNIVSITRGDSFLIARGKTRLLSNDKLLIVTAADSANEIRKALKLKK